MKRFLSVLSVLLMMSLLVFSTAYADASDKIVQFRINEATADFFISETFNTDNLVVKVATKQAELIDCNTIGEAKIKTRTTILVDASCSVPPDTRPKIIEYINYEIQTISENEELRIVSFGEECTIHQNFTSDRYDLDKAVQKIEFNKGSSAVYNAIYDTIPTDFFDEEPCLYRTIVITDGVDSANEGIIKDRLIKFKQK